MARFARRAVDEVPLGRAGLGFLVRSLHHHHQSEPLDRLARRAIATADPRTVSSFLNLLRAFRGPGLDTYTPALLDRAAEHPALADATTRRQLLTDLRAAGETEAADHLEATAPRPHLDPRLTRLSRHRHPRHHARAQPLRPGNGRHPGHPLDLARPVDEGAGLP